MVVDVDRVFIFFIVHQQAYTIHGLQHMITVNKSMHSKIFIENTFEDIFLLNYTFDCGDFLISTSNHKRTVKLNDLEYCLIFISRSYVACRETPSICT